MYLLTFRLDDSRAQRIIWILELLELEYDVKIYLRHPKTFRGPKELYDVHPLGKSPVLEIIRGDGKPAMKLAESGFIIQYLLRHYDPHHILTPREEWQQTEVDYFLHYSEGTLQPLQVSILVNHVARSVAPWGAKLLTKTVTGAINNAYYLHEWALNLQFLESQLEKTGTGFFVGNRLTGADIILSFPVYENVFDNLESVKEITGEKSDLSRTYPRLYAWSQMVANDPIYLQITEIMEQKVEDYIHQHSSRKRK